MDPVPDEELLLRASRGAGDALASLFDCYGAHAYGLALRVVGDRALAEDAVQEAFLDVWRSAGRFRPELGSPRSWILMLVHRRAVDLVRRTERRRGLDVPADAPVGTGPSVEDEAWSNEERDVEMSRRSGP